MKKGTTAFSMTVTAAALVAAQACGSNDDRSDGAGSGNVRVIMKSSDATVMSASRVGPATACSITLNSSTHNGDCITPLNVKGRVASFSLDSQYGLGASGPPRLLDLGGGSELAMSSSGAMAVGSFDFATPATSANSSSSDTIGSTTYYFDRVRALVASLDVQFEIPAANTNVTNRFWTVRHVFIPHPILTNSTISACVTDAASIASINANGAIFSSPTTAITAGDLLLCQKAAAATACADSDFRWIDSADGSLDATRPASPVRLSGTYAIQDISCSGSGATGDMSLGGLMFQANISPAITLTESDGTYTFNPTCTATGSTSGSCTGTPQSGAKVLATIDYDLTDALFAHSDVNLTTDTEVNILMELHKVLLKPIYVENNKTAAGTGLSPGVNATMTVTASSSF